MNGIIRCFSALFILTLATASVAQEQYFDREINHLKLNGQVHLVLAQGPAKLDWPGEHVETYLSGDTLMITSSDAQKVVLTLPNLLSITSMGNSILEGLGTFSTDFLDVKAYGTAQIVKLDVLADAVDLEVFGQSSVDLAVDTHSVSGQLHDAANLGIAGRARFQHFQMSNSRGELRRQLSFN